MIELLLNVLLALLMLSYPLAALRPRHVQSLSLLALLLALANGLLQWLAGGRPGPLFSAHPASAVVVLVVTFIGWVVLRFAWRYLAGEPRRADFIRGMLWLLAGVVLVVTTNHALVFLAGWVGISLALHRLLLFYPERPRAQLAAHKKFLLARSAELALATALALLYVEHHSFYLYELLQPTPGIAGQVAAVLIAIAALIKCAQLPVHGWLIQVVEAPTPVSALLHAGVINLGGYLLLLASPLLTPAARWLVLLVAGVSLVLATLAMTLQTSIKEKLAWSTSSQMGLMLLECALGLHALALLHLAAHSCYKAFSFLSSGEAVSLWLSEQMAPRGRLFPALWLSLPLLAGLYWLGVSAAALALLALALVLSGPLAALALSAGYLLQKELFEQLLLNQPSGMLPALWVVALALVLLVGFVLVSNPARVRLRHWLQAGCFLDHWATHLTLLLWPAPALSGRFNRLSNKESLL
ncbi:proton-conducting transporter membrane subunit [Gallaecimonas sp. GXIMD1310]|uniref:proton-conducting transporter transmembrane domain-containing protein n=1 Tax=Gallaecimonas sp. GXIMD1310 TaxID=3131926 RepID=UPI00324BA1C2